MKNLRVYFTSDTHGYLFPVDYATGNFSQAGMLSCTHDYKKDGNTLIIDGGDTIQGSPFTLYSHKLNLEQHPVGVALNKGQYDYITLGNHDFNYGQDHLKHYLKTVNATCLCANVSGLPIGTSEIKVLENGLRIGIVGVVTDYVNLWERPQHLENLEISDPYVAAKSALQSFEGQVDVSICIYHGGFECDLLTDEPLATSNENIASRICRELDFDLLLTGHQHMPIEGQLLHGTYIVQPQNAAKHYLCIDGVVEESGITFTSSFKTPTGIYDKEGLVTVLEVEDEVQKWLDAPVGYLDQPLIPQDKVDMALEGSSIVDFFHQIQFAATGAQISCTSLANDVKGFNQQVTVRDVVSTYVYPNTLCVVEVNGKQLKEILERTASYLDLDENGKPMVSNRFLVPKVEHYNYDFFAGITYIADLRKPVGERVLEICRENKPVAETDIFTLCMNNYRSTGAGGYEVYKTCPVVEEGQIEMSELIINYLAENKQVTVKRYPQPKFIY